MIAKELEAITGIDAFVLDGSSPLHQVSIGKRMSWAARRETTREEDMAYSLLGLFNVHMALIYGEGPRAFQRLQEKIIQQSDDHTIFAWKGSNDRSDPRLVRGLFAASPREFWNFRDEAPVMAENQASEIPTENKLFRVGGTSVPSNPITISNKGIGIKSSIKDLRFPWAPGDLIILILNCCYNGNPSQSSGIYLQRQGDNSYARVRVGELAMVHPDSAHDTLSIFGLRNTSDINEYHYDQPWTTSTRVRGELLEAEHMGDGTDLVRKHYEHAFYLQRRYFKLSRLLNTYSLCQIWFMDNRRGWRSSQLSSRSHDGDLILKRQSNFQIILMFKSRSDRGFIFAFMEFTEKDRIISHRVQALRISSEEAQIWHHNLIRNVSYADLISSIRHDACPTNRCNPFQLKESPRVEVSGKTVRVDGIPFYKVRIEHPAMFWYLAQVMRNNTVLLILFIFVFGYYFFGIRDILE